MRKALALLFRVVGCGPARTSSLPPLAADPNADGGVQVDAGPGATPDAGPTTTPASMDAGPCPGTPPLLWSRSIKDLQVDFRGVADEAGTLYWAEYTPPAPGTKNGPAWLVSADADGHERYRAPLASYHRRSAASRARDRRTDDLRQHLLRLPRRPAGHHRGPFLARRIAGTIGLGTRRRQPRPRPPSDQVTLPGP